MKIYRPTETPKPPPIIWGERYYEVPPSESNWRDYELRRCIESAVSCNEAAVREITKALFEAEVFALHSIECGFDDIYLPTVYAPGVMTPSQEKMNDALKTFAYDAYDSLADYFGAGKWEGWFVAPYFSAEGDTECSTAIGVFVDRHLLDEVIE